MRQNELRHERLLCAIEVPPSLQRWWVPPTMPKYYATGPNRSSPSFGESKRLAAYTLPHRLARQPSVAYNTCAELASSGGTQSRWCSAADQRVTGRVIGDRPLLGTHNGHAEGGARAAVGFGGRQAEHRREYIYEQPARPLSFGIQQTRANNGAAPDGQSTHDRRATTN